MLAPVGFKTPSDVAWVLQVAIKFLPRGEQTVNDYVLRELLHHRLLLHPHIIQVSHCWTCRLPCIPFLWLMMMLPVRAQFKEVFLTEDHLAIGTNVHLIPYYLPQTGCCSSEATECWRHSLPLAFKCLADHGLDNGSDGIC